MNSKLKYDKEELDILENFKNGKLKQSKSVKEDIKIAKEYSKNTISKSKHISIRLSEKDLQKLKIKSIETGISYQTLIGALIHQYTENKIKLKI